MVGKGIIIIKKPQSDKKSICENKIYGGCLPILSIFDLIVKIRIITS